MRSSNNSRWLGGKLPVVNFQIEWSWVAQPHSKDAVAAKQILNPIALLMPNSL